MADWLIQLQLVLYYSANTILYKLLISCAEIIAQTESTNKSSNHLKSAKEIILVERETSDKSLVCGSCARSRSVL